MTVGCWVRTVKATHTSPVGFKHTHTHTHTLGSSQAAGALRYAVDRDYQHSSVAALLSPHVTEFTLGSDWALTRLHLVRMRARGFQIERRRARNDEENEFRNRRGPHKGKRLQTGRELCKWVSH